MYKIEQKRLDKALLISFDGFPTVEETAQFVTEYMNNVSKINPSTTSLILDGKKLAVLKPDALPNLEQSYLAYMSAGYKNILVVKPENMTTQMQLNRVAKKVNFPVQYVETLEEALQISKNSSAASSLRA